MESDGDLQNPLEMPRAVLPYAQPSVSPVVVVWCRLLAIGLLAFGIERFVSIAVFLVADQAFRGQMMWGYLSSSGAAVLIWPLMAWYCWSSAPRVAMWVSRGVSLEEPTEHTASHRSDDLLVISLLILGLYQLGEGIPEIAPVIFRQPGTIHSLGDLPWGQMIAPLARIVIGCLILFGNQKIIGFLRGVRSKSDRQQ